MGARSHAFAELLFSSGTCAEELPWPLKSLCSNAFGGVFFCAGGVCFGKAEPVDCTNEPMRSTPWFPFWYPYWLRFCNLGFFCLYCFIYFVKGENHPFTTCTVQLIVTLNIDRNCYNFIPKPTEWIWNEEKLAVATEAQLKFAGSFRYMWIMKPTPRFMLNYETI